MIRNHDAPVALMNVILRPAENDAYVSTGS